MATTERTEDTPIIALCEGIGIPLWRGSEDDVLSRFHGATHAYSASMVVRLTADCPLLSPRIRDATVRPLIR